MGGIKGLFSGAKIAIDLNRFIENNQVKLIKAFEVIGEDAANDAKDKPASETYTDRTTNLRNSIGYGVKKNGRLVSSNGDSSAKALINEIKTKSDIEMSLVAGMNYSAPVEALEGYSVLSGSIPTRQEMEKTIKEILK